MHYLKDESYYNDLYDCFTVEKCRSMEKIFKEKNKSFQTKNGKIINKFAQQKAHIIVDDTTMYYIKGGRYANKAETISQWMQCDQDRDDKLANANEPDALCAKCNSGMECISKDLHNIGNQNQVLFFFTCPSCKSHRAFFDNGEEYKPSPRLCPQCQIKLMVKDSQKEKIITSIYSCSKCDYIKKEVFDVNVEKSEEKPDPNFEKDKTRFCLSKKEGEEYILQSNRLSSFMEKMKDEEENKEAYESAAKVKKLAIADLKNLLTPLVEKDGFDEFEFGKPEIRQGIILEFKLQDKIPGRSEYDSIFAIKKLINKTLDGTNWHLMSEGITYRLGFLNGRIRGIEDEKVLLELAKGKIAKK